MFKKISSTVRVHIHKSYFPMLFLCMLIVQFLLPLDSYADSPVRTISGTITYSNGFAPEGGIWITMYAMGENGGSFTTDALIREGDNTAYYEIPINLNNTNGSSAFTIKCEPQKMSSYSASIYSLLIDIAKADVPDIDFTTDWLSERTISGTIKYDCGLAPEGGIKIIVSARGEADFQTEVTIPEGSNEVDYTIPVDLYYTAGKTTFKVQCIPENEEQYSGMSYNKELDLNDSNLFNINLNISEIP
ncbi:hypothetical protein LY28_00247 [Ruminiclostridium sufflavum DSM 19573]|uniref:Uncharacterized protein n=1 Tax=Ruminiclostridium sufflavum DSM 19573 TaxID=1121337 RepID=A0A318XS57_9FIRM|nr:hypothetical protein [Ruminiclostridium sufflavum]PYG90364.1 hypothetical protein LY28_00247 [Ruminiclostridium sufflavum DSM 19573]